MKILIIRFSSLGDVILATSFVRNVRAAYPDAEISFYTKRAFIPVLENNPDIDFLVVWRPELGFFGNLRWIRRREYDIVFDIHASLRSTLLRYALRAGKFLAYAKAVKERRLLVKKKVFPKEYLPVPDRYNRLLTDLGVDAPERKPRLCLSDSEKRWADEFLGSRFGAEIPELIGIAPGARWPTKRWIPERYIHLAVELVKLNFHVLLFGENSDKNFILPFYGELTKEEREGIHLLLGEFDLRKFFAILSRVKLLVTVDSAALHAARAFSVPVVMLAGPTVREFGFFPLEGEGTVLETSLRCRPCSTHGSKNCLNPMKSFECMKNIRVDEVLHAVRGLLGLNVKKASSRTSK